MVCLSNNYNIIIIMAHNLIFEKEKSNDTNMIFYDDYNKIYAVYLSNETIKDFSEEKIKKHILDNEYIEKYISSGEKDKIFFCDIIFDIKHKKEVTYKTYYFTITIMRNLKEI
jgi:hypothetical protein